MRRRSATVLGGYEPVSTTRADLATFDEDDAVVDGRGVGRRLHAPTDERDDRPRRRLAHASAGAGGDEASDEQDAWPAHAPSPRSRRATSSGIGLACSRWPG